MDKVARRPVPPFPTHMEPTNTRSDNAGGAAARPHRNCPAAGARPWRDPWYAGAAIVFLAAFATVRADDAPWNYAVQASAAVNAASSQITLSWPPSDRAYSDNGTPEQTVYRKAVSDLGDPNWGDGASVPDGQNYFVDTVQPGVAYEYKIVRHYVGADSQYDAYGYIRTGIQVPLADSRGSVLLVVESGVADALGAELDQLTGDLAGDGWRVVRITDFSASSNPSDLRARIRSEYYQSGANVQAVFLLGHLPIVFSGNATNPDGHFVRSLPADGYYGDVSGDWGSASFDGAHWVFSDNVYPGPIALQVGRVDFADMPDIYAASPYSSEVELLRNYLRKDHAYRTAQRVPDRQALIGDAFGEYYFEGVDEPFSADAYRNFAPLFSGRLAVADNFHGGIQASNWISALANNTYTWAYGCGAGGDSADAIASLGPNGNPLTSVDLVTYNAKADFYLIFGSFVVDWSKPNNLLRATLAPSDYGLAAAWAGRPFLYFHAMGLGETIGYGMRISQNESGTLYHTPVTIRPSGNRYQQGVYLALLGDPTLRLNPIAPVANFSADGNGNATWSASPGVDVDSYRVYRLNTDSGRYELEATLSASTRAYTPATSGTHMIRAVTLQTGSGTYFDASEGVAWGANGNSSGGSSSGETPAPTTPSTDPSTGDLGNQTGPFVGPVARTDDNLPKVKLGFRWVVPPAR